MSAEYIESWGGYLEEHKLVQIANVLSSDGIIIVPTDTVYAVACHANSEVGLKRLAKIKGVDPAKANLSFMFSSFKMLSAYTAQLNNAQFRTLKHYLPGPYTFILPSSNILKALYGKKKTIGARIPDTSVIAQIISHINSPLVCTSLHDSDKLIDYTTDINEIITNWNDKVDFIIEGDMIGNIPSTVIDLTSNSPEVIRLGRGEW